MTRRLAVALSVAALSAPVLARADPPKFEYGTIEPVKEVVWKASANVGLIYTTGNSKTLTFSGGASFSRNDGKNKLSLDLSGAFARSEFLTAADTNRDGFIEASEINRNAKVTAESWMFKFRYDRFLTKNNALYIAALGAGDIPAGKELVIGGQAGYARHLYQSKRQDLAAETGYDYSFVDYADEAAKPKTLSIHSLRAFLGYTNALTPDTAIALSCEALFNLNPLDTPTGHADPFEDVRLLGKASLTTKLWKNFSFRVSFTAKFDNFPAPLAAFSAAPFAPGFVPAAEKLDTITEGAVILNFI